MNLREQSRAREIATGEDSVETIEAIYDRSSSGAIKCIYPGCGFRRFDAADVWRHVHGPAHAADRAEVERTRPLAATPRQG